MLFGKILQRRGLLHTRSHLDRVSPYDAHNRVFYIYSVGRFHNKPLYIYGETNDLDLVELQLQATLPMFKKEIALPVEYHMTAIERFDLYIEPLKTRMPVHGLESLDVFTCDDEAREEVIEMVTDLYRVYVDDYD